MPKRQLELPIRSRNVLWLESLPQPIFVRAGDAVVFPAAGSLYGGELRALVPESQTELGVVVGSIVFALLARRREARAAHLQR